MKTIEQVKSEREAAGAAYTAAVAAYLDAWVELHAYDLALSNGNYGDPTLNIQSFREMPEVLSHSEFPTARVAPALGNRAKARHEEILRELNPNT